MKGILIKTSGGTFARDYGEPLFQTVGADVGGYIEIVHPRGLPDPFVMIVNEEGLLMGLRINRTGCALYGTKEHGQPIVGDIVIMKEGWRDGEPDIVGLEGEDFDALAQLGLWRSA